MKYASVKDIRAADRERRRERETLAYQLISDALATGSFDFQKARNYIESVQPVGIAEDRQ